MRFRARLAGSVHVAMRAIALFTVVTVPMVAQPKDVNGWGRIKWGMTVAQAKVVYGSQVLVPDATHKSQSTKFVDRLLIGSFNVGDTKMQVSIETLPNSDKIREVTLSLPASSPRASRSSAYDDLRNSLTLKYGRPSHVEKKDDDILSESATWTFPSTVITLYHVESNSIAFGQLGLQYTATDKKALDAL